MHRPPFFLIDVVLPFVRSGKAVLALTVLLTGCDCSSDFLVPLTEAERDELRELHGDGHLPPKKCNELCIPPDAVTAQDGGPVESAEDVGYSPYLCHVVNGGAGPALICKGSFPDHCIGGRRPAGDVVSAASAKPKPTNSEGETFAALAQMESASVIAFVELAVELAAHDAPELLVRRALAAAIEEVYHAQAAAAIAKARGVRPTTVLVTLAPVRPLEQILTENVVDGIVLEGWAAESAAVEARRARASDVRDTLSTISIEEAGHAALARSIHGWAAPRVSRGARSAARAAAFESLRSLVVSVDRGAPSGFGQTAPGAEWETRVRTFARAVNV